MKVNNRNKSTRKVAKQLAKLRREKQTLNARFTKMSVRPAPRRRVARAAGGITATNIPMEVAYTVRQPSNRKVHRETACEYIGDFVILPTSKQGQSQKFMMNPLTLRNTRLFNIARNYQKFRFTKLSLKIQSSTTTSTNGLYVVGYNSNPDAEYNQDTAVASVFSLPGAQSANVWRTITSAARIEDRSKWYNLDDDSEESMQTTQGFFSVVVQSPTSATGPLVMPVLLEYTIELTGSSVLTENASAPFVWPAGTFTYNAVAATYSFTAAAGEITPPTIPDGTSYLINPAYPIEAFSANDTIKVVQLQGTWKFFRSVEDLNNNTPLAIGKTFDTGRTTWSRITSN